MASIKTMTVTVDFYKQFEELSNKLDELIIENKNINTTHKKEMKKLKQDLKKDFKQEKEELKTTITNLEKSIKEKDEMIEKLLNEIDRLKNQINKDSSNSSKPPSTDTGKKEKSGANLYNSRKKTDKKIGGQKGHKGHSLTKNKVEKMIEDKLVETRTIYHESNNRGGKAITKYRIGLEVNVYVEKHIFKHNPKADDKIPKEFYTDVTYDNSIKALTIELGTYNVVALDRLSDLFKVLSKGVIDISNGTLVNFLKEFSLKSKPTLDNLENDLLNKALMNTDETTNDNKWYIRNYSNSETVIYKPHKNKGHKQIEEHDILTKYTGGIIHDHDTAMYKYGSNNYECNVHLGRYLEEIIQNVSEVTWAKDLKELIFKAYHDRKVLIRKDSKSFSNMKTNEISAKYDEIISLAKKESKNIKSTYYKEKALKLVRRCDKYKDNHLAFIYDFSVPFDNNPSERDLRIIKIKTKISGGFKNIHSAEAYCDAISIIKTSLKRKINPFESIKSIFNNEVLFVN